jgi:hypothetical protein
MVTIPSFFIQIKIWQSTHLCLLEMSVLAHLILLVISYNSVNDSGTKSSLIQYYLTGCLAASFLRDRLSQFARKLFTFVIINITNYSIKKQRKRISLPVLVLNFMFFVPFNLLIIVVSCIASAPLLPLFTFPFFMLGFPRHKHFWPQKRSFFSMTTHSNDKTKESASDSSFYRQLKPQLVASFKGTHIFTFKNF